MKLKMGRDRFRDEYLCENIPDPAVYCKMCRQWIPYEMLRIWTDIERTHPANKHLQNEADLAKYGVVSTFGGCPLCNRTLTHNDMKVHYETEKGPQQCPK